MIQQQPEQSAWKPLCLFYKANESTCVTTAAVLAMRRREAISEAAKESAIETAAQPASTMPKYATTASRVIGIAMAIAWPAHTDLLYPCFDTVILQNQGPDS